MNLSHDYSNMLSSMNPSNDESQYLKVEGIFCFRKLLFSLSQYMSFAVILVFSTILYNNNNYHNSVLVRRAGCGVRLPGFETWLLLLLLMGRD